jgi:Mrp family chromosome partitioning ATPase
MVTPLPPPAGWRPENSLNAASRHGLAHEVIPAGSRGCFVVGVTGPGSDLKARVASELAIALAHYRRVLLLEADFQRPTLHQWMCLEMSLATGYSHQLRARVYADQGDPRLRVVECGPSLHVLAEGMMRAPGMILSREFEDSVMSLRAFYDLIVVNGPPSTAEIDLQALAGVVDGVVMCGQRGPVPLVFRAKRLFTAVES